MGYYTGSGVTSNGGESTRTLRTWAILGAGNPMSVRQKTVTSVNRKSGVSLETAKANHTTESLTTVYGGSGLLAWIIFDAEGTRTIVGYSQIGDSNLYELTTTTETYSAWRSNDSGRSLT